MTIRRNRTASEKHALAVADCKVVQGAVEVPLPGWAGLERNPAMPRLARKAAAEAIKILVRRG